MTDMRLYLLGEPHLERDAEGVPLRTRKQQRWIALLAYLALHKREISRLKLASLIWNDVDDSLERLRKHTLNELRGKIGADLLEASRDNVRLRSESVWVDVNVFRQALTDYRLCLSTEDDTGAAIHYLEQAVSVYRGDFLGSYTLSESEDFYFWQIGEANSLRDEFNAAVEDLLTALCLRLELEKAQHYAAVWRRQMADNFDVHAWMTVLLELSHKHAEAQRYGDRLKPVLEKWGKTAADLVESARSIHQRLTDLNVPKRQPQRLKDPEMQDRAIMRLLTEQLKTAEIQQARDNPALFEGYYSVLAELAERSPLEAVKAAEEIADTLFDLNDSPTEANDVLDRVEAILTAKQGERNREAQFRLMLQRMNIYRAFGLTRQAVELLRQIEEDDLCLEAFDSRLLAEWYVHLGLIQCWVEGDYGHALESLERSKTHYRQSGQLKMEAGVLGDIAMVYWNQGDLRRAEGTLRTAREQASRLGDYRALLKLTGNLGLVYLHQGRLNEAYTLIEEHYRLATRLGHLREMRRARGNRGITKYHLRDYDGAIEDLEADIRTLKAVNEGTLYTTVNLSRCYIACGDMERGREMAAWSLAGARERGYYSIEIIALRALAEAQPPDEARELLLLALNAARGKRRMDEAACLLSLAQLTPDSAAHEEYWHEGVKILREMGAQAWIEVEPLRLPTL